MTLLQFAHKVLDNLPSTPIFTETRPDCTVEVLAIEGNMQAERLTYGPYVHALPHKHKDIEALDYYLSGDLALRLKGHPFHVDERTVSPSRMIRIRKGVEHEAISGPRGLSFISFQRHEGEPEEVVGCPHRIYREKHDTSSV